MTRRILAGACWALVLLFSQQARGQTAPRCEVNHPVVFAGLDWASNAFHTAVAQRIVRDGYGCAVDTLPGSTVPLINAVARGDIHVVMEVWKANTPAGWDTALAAGKVVEAGVNFPDATQGWYVPRHVIEGPRALAPGLKSVADLPRYKSVFADQEEPGKGRFYNCPAGWQCELYNSKKLGAYGLAAHFNNFRPGTGAALDAAIVSALKRKRPILFYYWGPSWLLGQLGKDLVMLKEPAFDPAKAATAYPAVQVMVGASKAFTDKAPALYAFLRHYRTTAPLVSQALAGMQSSNGSADEAARLFLKAHPEVWTSWVPADVASRVKAGL